MTGTDRFSITKGAFFAGASLSGAYILCVILDFLFPDLPMGIGWSALLPVDAAGPSTFITRFAETFLAGVIFALAVLPICNFYFRLRDGIEEFQAKRYGNRWRYL